MKEHIYYWLTVTGQALARWAAPRYRATATDRILDRQNRRAGRPGTHGEEL